MWSKAQIIRGLKRIMPFSVLLFVCDGSVQTDHAEMFFYRDLALDNNNNSNKYEGDRVEVKGVDLEEAEICQGGEEELLLDWVLTVESSLVREAVEWLNDG